jgi:hypothetical protein
VREKVKFKYAFAEAFPSKFSHKPWQDLLPKTIEETEVGSIVSCESKTPTVGNLLLISAVSEIKSTLAGSSPKALQLIKW